MSDHNCTFWFSQSKNVKNSPFMYASTLFLQQCQMGKFSLPTWYFLFCGHHKEETKKKELVWNPKWSILDLFLVRFRREYLLGIVWPSKRLCRILKEQRKNLTRQNGICCHHVVWWELCFWCRNYRSSSGNTVNPPFSVQKFILQKYSFLWLLLHQKAGFY